MRSLVTILGLFLSFQILADGPSLPKATLIDTFSKQVSAGNVEFSFQIKDSRTGQPISEADLNVVHEKKLHVFVFDLSLTVYRHIHPEFKNGVWSTTTDLPKNGTYWVWAQGQLAVGAEDFTANYVKNVVNGGPAGHLPSELTIQGSGFDGNSGVKLTQIEFKAGEMAMPMLHFSRADKTKPDIRPYLGALAHVLIVSLDGDEIVHVHPMDHNGHLMLHTEFQTPGFYRVWIQFDDGGKLNTVPLAIKVN